MSGEGEVGAIQGLGRGDVRQLCRGSLEAEEDPREVMEPVCCGGPSPKGVLEAAMKVFY